MPGVVEIESFLGVIGEVLTTIPGLGVGHGRPPLPAQGEKEPELPYTILYSIPWDTYDSPPMSSDQDVPLAFQTTTVGATAQQARLADDRVRAKLVAMSSSTHTWETAIVAPGLVIMGRACTLAGGEDSDVRLTSIPSRFVFYVSTAVG